MTAEGQADAVTRRAGWVPPRGPSRRTARGFADMQQRLPTVAARLRPVVAQWDRLSPVWCYMLVLAGPVKADLIFTEPRPASPKGRSCPVRPPQATVPPAAAGNNGCTARYPRAAEQAVSPALQYPNHIKLVRSLCAVDLHEGIAQVAGQEFGGGDGVVADADADGAVAAGRFSRNWTLAGVVYDLQPR